jgi:integrase
MKNEKSEAAWAGLMEEYFFKTPLRKASEWSYTKVLKGFRQFVGEDVMPESVTQRDVLRWRRYVLQEKKLSSHTWNNKVTHMRALFNFALKTEYIAAADNPFNGVSIKKAEKRKKILSKSQLIQLYLTMEQFEEQLLTAKGRDCKCALAPVWFWRIVLDTLRYTGMRQNQLLHVRVKDVSLRDNCITLRQEGSKTHLEWAVPIVRQLRPGLELLLKRMQECDAGPSDHLFHYERLTCLDREREHLPADPSVQPLRSFFRRLSEECGFAVSAHRFRHTLATQLMEAPDRNLHLVKGLLGHRSITTTMEYIDINMEVVGKTLERELALYTDK